MLMFLLALPALLLQSDDSNPLGTVIGVFFGTVVFALVVTFIAGIWKTSRKPGTQDGER